MAKSDLVVVTDEPTWAVDLSKWRVKDTKKWNLAVKTDDYETIGEILPTIAPCMPDGSPISVEAIDELLMVDYAEVILAVQDAMVAIFRSARKSK